MPDYYPQEKGVIKRDRTGEARDILAKELMYESLGMIPVGGMAAKMSSPAVDVLWRWIRRFRTKKGKPPTVPAKHIEKALRHEDERTDFGEFGLYDRSNIKDRSRGRMIRDMLLYGDAEEGIGTEHYLGVKEKEARDGLIKLLRGASNRWVNRSDETGREFLGLISDTERYLGR